MVDNGAGPTFSKEEGQQLWVNNNLDIDKDCLCVGCPWEESCDWRYDLYNTKSGSPGWDCLGAE